MGHTASKPTDGFDLLCLPNLRLQALPPRHITKNDDPAKGTAPGTRLLVGMGLGADRAVEALVLALPPTPTIPIGMQRLGLCWGSAGHGPVAGFRAEP